jgi:hypothetical protein
MPQPPQLVGSVDRFEQVGPVVDGHIWRGGPHGPSHTEFTQADPGVQWMLQPPQLLASAN